MSYDPTICEIVPYAWILVIGKMEQIYCKVLYEIIVLLDYAWMPSFCVCDFEKTLINQYIAKRVYRN
ncbi:hypothetical protein MXB_5475 [Myxobolus squamalis]|nr:hypothetical protein MXB_5475 [Myxobolus squamalis]